jgi:hypothetical protein
MHGTSVVRQEIRPDHHPDVWHHCQRSARCRTALSLRCLGKTWKRALAKQPNPCRLVLAFIKKAGAAIMSNTTPMGIGHHTCHHLYLLMSSAAKAVDQSRRLRPVERLSLAHSLWPEVVRRTLAGQSVRRVAREFGVSHATVHRIVKRYATEPCAIASCRDRNSMTML